MWKKLGRWRHLLLLLIFIGACLPDGLSLGAAFSLGYKSAGEVKSGMIVSLNPEGKVVAAAGDTVSLLGVVVEPASSSIVFSGPDKGDVQVANSGVASVLVSDLNGQIKSGDQVSVSPVAGVGMKLDPTRSVSVIGTAQSDFDARSGQSVDAQVSMGKNKTKQIKVAQIAVLVNPTFYTPKTSPLNFLQQAGTTVAGRPVSATKAILAGILLLIAILSVSVLLYTAVRSSLVSIGRNPLAEGAVRKELLRVLLVAPLILLAALALIYAILRG